MSIRIQAPNGEIVEFPDGTPDAEIERAMRATYGAPQSPGYQRAYEREQEMRRGATPEEMRTGRLRNGGRDIPVPDFLIGPAMALQNFNRGAGAAPSQMLRNMGVADEAAAAASWLGQGAQNLVRRVRGQPIEITQNEAARAAADYQNNEQRRVAREQPNVNAASIALSVPAFAGSPAAVVPRISALQGGAAAAGINAPFALARQQGTLEERLPDAALETGAVFAGGAVLQGIANGLMRAPRPNTAPVRAQRFENAGVRPTLAATQGGAPALATKTISENIFAGPLVRRRLRDSINDTAQGAERVARAYGPRGSAESTGATVQSGLRRWAFGEGAGASRPAATSVRNWSFDQRAEALYDRVFTALEQAQRQWRGRGQAPPITADATRITLDDILSRNTPEVADLVNDQQLYRFRNIIMGNRAGGGSQSAGSNLTFRDLRDLRSYVRRLRRQDPSLRPNLDDAALARLEGALSDDIMASAQFIGGAPLARQLRQVDRYYRMGNERIQNALRPFLRDGVTEAQAYTRLRRMAEEGGRQNTEALIAVRRSLQPDEWRQVAASVIDDLGRASKGHPYAIEGAFSVEQFASRYNALSQEGRRALFGDLGSVTGRNAGGDFINLSRALDDLAHVASYQKGVEAMANSSRSGSVVQNVGMGTMAATGNIPGAASLIAGMAITGEMLTNPAFVRWLTSVSRSGAGAGGRRRHLAALAQLAARDPALAPLHAELAQRAVAHFQPRQEQPQRQREPHQ